MSFLIDQYLSSFEYKHLYPFEEEKKLRNYVLEGNEKKAIEAASDFLLLLRKRMQTLEEIKSYILQLIIVICRKCFQMGVEVDDLMGSTLYYAEDLLACNNLEQIDGVLGGFVEEIVVRVKLSDANQKDWIIKKAQQYIEAHYHKSITLNDVARLIGLSPCYFSRTFSQLTGSTFQVYLTRVRIGEAKRLLTNYKFGLQEIATQVGYEDVSYFIRVFKRIVGFTPRQYAKVIARQNDAINQTK